MPHPASTAYDSFLVRLWREPTTGSLLRVEIEHVQDGVIRDGRAVPPEWILDALGLRVRTDSETGIRPQSRKEQGDDDKE